MNKDNIILTKQLIAPCGMNCSICMAYLREKNKCLGCRMPDPNMPISRARCKIKNCKTLKKEKANWRPATSILLAIPAAGLLVLARPRYKFLSVYHRQLPGFRKRSGLHRDEINSAWIPARIKRRGMLARALRFAHQRGHFLPAAGI